MKNKLSWQTSCLLDVLRLTAALVVFLYHSYNMWFNDDFGKALVHLSHFAVIIFFVLSGYLIAYTTSVNNRGPLQYAQARLGRIYSILLPAIIITAICHIAVFYVDHSLYNAYTRPPNVVRYILSTFFVNEVWFFSTTPLINGPIWSLGYEFWYYTLFGLWFYFRHLTKTYVISTVLIALLIGPSVLSLMPIWLLGCVAYKASKFRLSNFAAAVIFCVAFAGALLLLAYFPALPFELGQPPMYYANQFIKDIIIGIFICVSFWAASSLGSNAPKPKYINSFRKVADLTFPLYLLHVPLLVLWRGLFSSLPKTFPFFLLAMGAVMLVITVVGFYLESKRYAWDNFFGNMLRIGKANQKKYKALLIKKT